MFSVRYGLSLIYLHWDFHGSDFPSVPAGLFLDREDGADMLLRNIRSSTYCRALQHKPKCVTNYVKRAYFLSMSVYFM